MVDAHCRKLRTVIASDSERKQTASLSGAVLRAAFAAAAKRVIEQRDELNRINVFPVPDGDTGSNLAFTCAAMLRGLHEPHADSVGAVMRTAALQVIDGARGNSGAILAQFFYGFAQSTRELPRLSLDAARQAFLDASARARAALSEPREGTIISVMQAFSAAFASASKASADRAESRASRFARWREAFQTALSAAQQALAKTPQQLRELQAHGVVDAGAQGFVYFLTGMQSFMRDGKRAAAVDEAVLGADYIAMEHDVLAVHEHYRYCSECTIEHADVDQLKAALRELPLDSVVLAGGQDRARLHAHIDNPVQLFELAARFGTVSARKAEDMRAQVRSAGNQARVAIVCDTAADLPADLADQLFVHQVPVRINFGNDEFIDRITLSSHDLYLRMRANATAVRTSQPPTGEFRRTFDRLLSHHDSVLCLNLSHRLSGTHQAAKTAANFVERSEANKSITVFDTFNASAGQGLLVLHAAELAQRGLNVQQIEAELARLKPQAHTFAMVRDARYGARGGRMPKWLVPINRWLRARLVLGSHDGKIKAATVLWGERELAKRFAVWVRKRLQLQSGDTRWRIMVGHCDAADDAAAIAAVFADLDCLVVEAGTGVGAHAGPGSLVLGALRR